MSFNDEGDLLSRREFARCAVGVGLMVLGADRSVRAAEADASEVFYSPSVSAEALFRLYEAVTDGGFRGRVGIKIHGGEAEVNLSLWEALRARIPNAAFVETNWASGFGGARGSSESHIAAIRAQGVTGPIDILDRSSTGGDLVKVPVHNGIELREIEVPSAMLREYGGIVNLTNFKIPSFAGYTGALKNTGIGLVSPDAKALIHGPGYQRIPEFFDRMADAGKGVAEAMGRRLVHISVLTGIRAGAVPGAPHPKGGNLGIFASRDMAALDQACVDAVWGLTPAEYDAFDRQTAIDHGFIQLKSMERAGLGNRRYRLIQIQTKGDRT